MDDEIEMSNKEGGGTKEEEGSKGDDDDDGANAGEVGDREGGTSLDGGGTISTAPSPTERVLLLLTLKPPRTMMTKRGAWWEYLSSGYAQWDTRRP